MKKLAFIIGISLLLTSCGLVFECTTENLAYLSTSPDLRGVYSVMFELPAEEEEMLDVASASSLQRMAFFEMVADDEDDLLMMFVNKVSAGVYDMLIGDFEEDELEPLELRLWVEQVNGTYLATARFKDGEDLTDERWLLTFNRSKKGYTMGIITLEDVQRLVEDNEEARKAIEDKWEIEDGAEDWMIHVDGEPKAVRSVILDYADKLFSPFLQMNRFGWEKIARDPMDEAKYAKLGHLMFGIILAMFFWRKLERSNRGRTVNPFWVMLATIWGASGFFFFRWFFVDLNIPFLREWPFYLALPDWDGMILGTAAHRNLLFHSAIIPLVLMFLALFTKMTWLRDLGIGLAVGISSHLILDLGQIWWNVFTLTRSLAERFPNMDIPYFDYVRNLDYITDLSGPMGLLWIAGSVIVGLFFAYSLSGRSR